jgi:hypothetical protein
LQLLQRRVAFFIRHFRLHLFRKIIADPARRSVQALSFDWHTATNAERQALYKPCRQLVANTRLSWRALFKEAAGLTFAHEKPYVRSFSAGRNSRKHCALIHAWLVQQHPQLAADVDARLAALRARSPKGVWDSFVERHAAPDGLAIVPAPRQKLSVVALATREPMHDKPLRRGERFCFRLTVAAAGTAAALQWTKGLWHVLPLTAAGMQVAVQPGPQLLPRNPETGAVLPLHELTDMGLHRFVFVVHNDAHGIRDALEGLERAAPLAPSSLDRLSNALLAATPQRWRIYRVAATFTD